MRLEEMIRNAYSNGKSVFDIAILYNVSEEKVLKILGITKFKSLSKDEKTWMKKYIKLQCIKERSDVINLIRKGEFAYADITSVYINSDGDTFMQVYDSFGKFIGNCNMNRFRSVK